MKSTISMQDYSYVLPQEKIANHPLSTRDASKLLVYQKGIIEHTSFTSIVDFLPANSILFFNDTKVIPARIPFKKDSGAEIEIFLLNPTEPSTLMADAMLATNKCIWQCTIGNLKRWKDNQILTSEKNEIQLRASLVNRETGLVAFSWDTPQTFGEIVLATGVTPLPPYIKRDASPDDAIRYQTIYSHYEGAVAAPTAGLHFTKTIFESLKKKGIDHDFLTLHVSAGTFLPVKSDNALEHNMHHEQIIVTRNSIQNLLQPEKFIVPVGTTSMRTLESLYWYGVKLIENPECEFIVTQNDPYTERKLPTQKEALHAIATNMDRQKMNSLTGSTSIFIYPGYPFKICQGLITNFHLPASTLILLVAALIGEDWRKVYKEAIQNDYRFLSYGDSSVLIP